MSGDTHPAVAADKDPDNKDRREAIPERQPCLADPAFRSLGRRSRVSGHTLMSANAAPRRAHKPAATSLKCPSIHLLRSKIPKEYNCVTREQATGDCREQLYNNKNIFNFLLIIF